MHLEDIGFYTLSDDRARYTSSTSRLARCEILVTGRCNFSCPYCRHVGGPDIVSGDAFELIAWWAGQGLRAVRFSGGEPTLHPDLGMFVSAALYRGIQHIAVSSNGASAWSLYKRLIDSGVNDFSISLDACCASDGDQMAGVAGAWDKVVSNIEKISKEVYTTVGIVLTEINVPTVNEIIRFAAKLGVHDIRVIPAAQDSATLSGIKVDTDLLAKFPILRYRVQNMQSGRPVRGLQGTDSRRCALVLDDMAVLGDKHYPCIIYLREGGDPIGDVSPAMRTERERWCNAHDSSTDPICSKNCLDVCIDYNNKVRELGG